MERVVVSPRAEIDEEAARGATAEQEEGRPGQHDQAAEEQHGRQAQPARQQWQQEQRDDLAVKVRSLARPASASFDGEQVTFAMPEFGVAPGQAAVVYCGERVLGGGWISETVPAELEPA